MTVFRQTAVFKEQQMSELASNRKSGDESDPLAPQREAAMFYGLFLRGHSAEALRRDIELPRDLVEKLTSRQACEESFRESIQRIYQYRRKVLAIFDELILNERTRMRLQ